MAGSPENTVWIASTRGGPEGAEPVCRLTWGPATWYATVGDVRATALDLVTCAAYAEMMMGMRAKLDLAPRVASGFTADVLIDAHPDKAEQGSFGLPSTILLMPAGASETGEALVLLMRDHAGAYKPKRLRGKVDAAEARRMAARWYMVAEASEQDRLIPEALPDSYGPDGALDTDLLFAKLRLLRDRKGDPT